MLLNYKYLIALSVGFIAGNICFGNSERPKTVRDLFEQVNKDRVTQTRRNKDRETRFLSDLSKQKQLLKQAQQNLQASKKEHSLLSQTFSEQESLLGKLEQQLEASTHSLGDLFGVIRQTAGDLRGRLKHSIITAEFPQLLSDVDKVAKSKTIPKTQDIEVLWLSLLKELTESGQTSKFERSVVSDKGHSSKQTLHRVGTFHLLSDKGYFAYDSESDQVQQYAQQPSEAYLSMVTNFISDHSSVALLGIDVTKGSLLSLLAHYPSLQERFEKAGIIGVIIALVFILGVVLSIAAYFNLSYRSWKLRKTTASTEVNEGPVYRLRNAIDDQRQQNRSDFELELELEEVIGAETAHYEKGLSFLKTLAAIAPLLGLLGTVTGMIGTFQSITIFGTSDPKLMAGGISQALITTVLGLVTAIPLIVIHNLLSTKSLKLRSFLEEQLIGNLILEMKNRDEYPIPLERASGS